MSLHAAHDRLGAVTATWQLLHQRLTDLGVDMDETTTRPYHSLVTADARSAGASSIRHSS